MLYVVKCEKCRRRKAVWRVGSDGFGAKKGVKVCDSYGCRTWADGGYPVTFHAFPRVAGPSRN